jgi:hypothetical protein
MKMPGLDWRPWATCSGLLGLLCWGLPVAAHDTWFEPQPSPNAGEVRLLAGTGNRFPVFESSIGEDKLPQALCRHGQAAAQPLNKHREGRAAQELRSRPGAPPSAPGAGRHGGISCWAQLPSYEIELRGPVVTVYHDEIKAPASLRAAWAAQETRGLPWRERYTKYLRTELLDLRLGTEPAPAPQASGMGMEILIDSARPRVGESLGFRVLREGQALSDFAVELVSGSTNAGFWLRTDASGRAEIRLPLPGRWLLRGTDVRPDPQRPDHWDSRFVTLAFEAAPSP